MKAYAPRAASATIVTHVKPFATLLLKVAIGRRGGVSFKKEKNRVSAD
jgi:hypothetical protein